MSVIVPARSRSSETTRLALIAVALGLGAAALTVVLTQLGPLKAVVVLIVVCGLIWFATTRRPQLALALIVAYLGLLDGYLKLSTGSSYVTFARDALLYAFVVGLLIRAAVDRRPIPAPPLSVWVVGYTVLVLVQVLNPNDGSLTHTLAGLRQDLEFVPMFFLAFAFVRTKQSLRRLVWLMVLIAVGNAIFTIIQDHLTPAQLASWGSGYASRIYGTGSFKGGGRVFTGANGLEYTRPFGLMSDAGTGGIVCAYVLGCVFALATLPGRGRYLLPMLAVGALLIVGMIDSQGRAVIAVGVVIAVAFGAMNTTARRTGRVAILLLTTAVAAIVYFGATVYFAGGASRDGTLGASQIVKTAAQSRGVAIVQGIPFNITHYPFGSGLGSGGPAVTQSGAPSEASSFDAETEISLAVLESGVPGMLVIVGFTVTLFYLGVRRLPREPDLETRILLAGLIAPLAGVLILYWVSPLLATTPTGPYLFGIGGIISYWLVERPRAAAMVSAGDPALQARRERPNLAKRTPAARRAGVRISVVVTATGPSHRTAGIGARLVPQLVPGDEMIVVDAGDASDLRASLGPNVTIISAHGVGPAAARNLGWRAATGDVVAFVDADVQPDPAWLESVRTAFQGRPELAAVEGRILPPPLSPLRRYLRRLGRGSGPGRLTASGPSRNVAYRRRVLEKLGGFDADAPIGRPGDVDLRVRAAEHGEVEFATGMVVQLDRKAVLPGRRFKPRDRPE